MSETWLDRAMREKTELIAAIDPICADHRKDLLIIVGPEMMRALKSQVPTTVPVFSHTPDQFLDIQVLQDENALPLSWTLVHKIAGSK